jgi:TonB-linked SusC/RagA family outer membrane protein
MKYRRAKCMIALLAALATPFVAAGQETTGTVRGQVRDSATAQPLSGVQVSIPATSQGTLTDARGMFLLTGISPGTVTLDVQMIGYGTGTRKVAVTAGQTAVADFTLAQRAVVLNQLVVTATGQQRERELGNAVATINVASIPVAPPKGVQGMLSAQVPGAYVMANSGQPGAGGTIRLRGVNSVSMGNNPIIYVDGVRIYSGTTPTMPLNRQGELSLNDIDPADIARIEVIRGPAATTLYGTQASGGVIQIFTKRGTTGAPLWSADISAGFNNQGHVGPSADPTGMWLNKCSGILTTGAGKQFEDPSCPASGSWLRNGPITRFDLSVRGGQGQMSYYLSGFSNNTDGTLRNSQTKAAGFRANFGFRPMDKVSLNLNTSYTRRNTGWVPDGNSAEGVLLNVSRGPSNNFKGSGCTDAGVVCLDNGAIFTTDNTTKSDHFITGLTLSYSPGTWLTNRLTFGFDYNGLVNQNVLPFGFVTLPTGEMYWNNWVHKLLTVDYVSTLQNSLGQSFSSSFSLGGQMYDDRVESLDVTANDFAGPGQPTIVTAATRDVTDDVRQRVVNAGFFLQEVLGWQDRAFLTGGLRVDGNSAFGKGFGLQPYPKVSASYILSDHAFWPKSLIQTFKLRAAIGESGKAPGAFDAERTWEPIAGDNGQPGFTPAQLGDANLGPERTWEYEAGFEMGALQNRLGVDFTIYNQHTSDALIPVTAPPSDGFLNTQLENVGKLQNHGIELAVHGTIIRTDNVQWNARVDYSSTYDKAVDLGGQVITVQTTARTYVEEGYPVPSYFGKKVLNPNAYADPIIQDDQYLGTPYPTQIIALNTSLRLFNSLTASATGAWDLGASLMNAVGYQNSGKGTWYGCYATQAKLNAYAAGDSTALNDVTALQRLKCSQVTGVRDYDWWIEPDNFFRLRDVTLTYQLPQWGFWGGRSATLTLSAQNLLTVTKYDGTDPEVSDERDSSMARRDYYVFPEPRTFLLSLHVSF